MSEFYDICYSTYLPSLRHALYPIRKNIIRSSYVVLSKNQIKYENKIENNIKIKTTLK